MREDGLGEEGRDHRGRQPLLVVTPFSRFEDQGRRFKERKKRQLNSV